MQGRGVTVTASHNPPEYNGIKIWNKEGIAFSKEEKIIEELVYNNNFKLQKWDKLGNILYRHEESLEIHKKEIIKNIENKEKYKIVIDCGNGAASLFSPYVFKELGNDVISINAHPTGYFSHDLEPNRENLKNLSDTVKATDADLGIAHDGDADRVGIIDENGEYVDYDVILALIASYVLKEGDIFITTVDASMKIDRYLEKYGISVKRTKVGDVAVAKEMKNVNSDFGGEPSGTWIFGEFQMTPDGIYSGTKVLEMKEKIGNICTCTMSFYFMIIIPQNIISLRATQYVYEHIHSHFSLQSAYRRKGFLSNYCSIKTLWRIFTNIAVTTIFFRVFAKV